MRPTAIRAPIVVPELTGASASVARTPEVSPRLATSVVCGAGLVRGVALTVGGLTSLILDARASGGDMIAMERGALIAVVAGSAIVAALGFRIGIFGDAVGSKGCGAKAWLASILISTRWTATSIGSGFAVNSTPNTVRCAPRDKVAPARVIGCKPSFINRSVSWGCDAVYRLIGEILVISRAPSRGPSGQPFEQTK